MRAPTLNDCEFKRSKNIRSHSLREGQENTRAKIQVHTGIKPCIQINNSRPTWLFACNKIRGNNFHGRQKETVKSLLGSVKNESGTVSGGETQVKTENSAEATEEPKNRRTREEPEGNGKVLRTHGSWEERDENSPLTEMGAKSKFICYLSWKEGGGMWLGLHHTPGTVAVTLRAFSEGHRA